MAQVVPISEKVGHGEVDDGREHNLAFKEVTHDNAGAGPFQSKQAFKLL